MRLVVLAAVVACTAPRPTAPEPTRQVFAADHVTEPAPASPSCVDDGKPYDPKTLRDRIALLASPKLDGRVPGTAGDLAARAFIAERFRCLGLQPALDAGFEQPFVDGTAKTANLVGLVRGSDPDLRDQIVLVAAHHDHLGHGHLGANDNASGVVALLAVAQALAQRDTAPKRTIVFATFGAEEDGMIGSYYFAKHAPIALDQVVQVINLDMVGSHASRGLVAAMGAFPKHTSRKLLDKLDDKYPKLHVSAGGRARGSDFEPFCKLGIPYVFFWTPDARCYHEACDTVDKIDVARMVDIASLAGDLTAALGDSDVDLLAARKKLGCGA